MTRTHQSDRLWFLGLAVLVVLSVLVVRLWQLQVVRGEEYYRVSDEQRLVRIPVPGARGDILDRNGIPLATTRLVFTISMLTETQDDLLSGSEESSQLVNRLADLLGMTFDDVVSVVKSAKPSPLIAGYQLVELSSIEISPEAVSQIVENRDDYPGIIITRKPVRCYPAGDAAAQIVGYVRQISPDELSLLSSAGYRGTDLVGKLGVEKSFETVLRAIDGVQLLEVDRKRTLVQTIATEPPTPGGDVVLTIDLPLQIALEKAIDEQLELLRSQPQAKAASGGIGVVLDVKTGQILAAATCPATSPATYSAFSGPMNEWPGNELDKATKASLAPGSVWKPVTVLAALDSGVIETSYTHKCDGQPDPALAGKACHVHGKVNAARAIEVSCNAYLWAAGKAMWRVERDEHREIAQTYALGLGFGGPTGFQQQIALMGGVPDAEAWGNVPASTPRYGDSLNSAIGQGDVTVSPLQIAQLYATLARSGMQLPTSLILEVRKADGTVISADSPAATRVNIAAEYIDLVNEGLRRVPVSGTAAGAFSGFPLDVIPVAGKTGTAEIPGKDSHGWFAAYAPANDPEIVVVVVIEHGGYGSSAAAPVARRVLEYYFGVEYETGADEAPNQTTG